jgi:hypothetical protein
LRFAGFFVGADLDGAGLSEEKFFDGIVFTAELGEMFRD